MFIFASGAGGIGRKGLREEPEEELESHWCPLPIPTPPTPGPSALSCRRIQSPGWRGPGAGGVARGCSREGRWRGRGGEDGGTGEPPTRSSSWDFSFGRTGIHHTRSAWTHLTQMHYPCRYHKDHALALLHTGTSFLSFKLVFLVS